MRRRSKNDNNIYFQAFLIPQPDSLILKGKRLGVCSLLSSLLALSLIFAVVVVVTFFCNRPA